MPVITPHVPEGLIEIMKALAKGVVKDKPENIYEFAAIHFEKLVFERDGRMDKGYENFRMDEDYFRYHEKYDFSNCKSLIKAKKKKDGKTRAGRPRKITIPNATTEAISDKDILSPEPLQNKLKPRKMSAIKPSEGLNSIQEEDGLDTGGTTDALENEKRQTAAFVIQEYFRKLLRRKNDNVKDSVKEGINKKAMTEEAAAFIIQRTFRHLYGNRKVMNNVTKMESGKESDTSVTESDKNKNLLGNDSNRNKEDVTNLNTTVVGDNSGEKSRLKLEKEAEVESKNLDEMDDKVKVRGEGDRIPENQEKVINKDVDEVPSKNLEIQTELKESKLVDEEENQNKSGLNENSEVVEEAVRKEKRPGSYAAVSAGDETSDGKSDKADSKKIKKKSVNDIEENNEIDTKDHEDEKEISNLTDNEKIEKMVTEDVEKNILKNKDNVAQKIKEVSKIPDEVIDMIESEKTQAEGLVVSETKSPTIESDSTKVDVENLKETIDKKHNEQIKPEDENEDDITSTKSFEEFISEPGTRSVMEGQNILADSATPSKSTDDTADHEVKESAIMVAENKNDETKNVKTVDTITTGKDDKEKEDQSQSEVIMKEAETDDLKRQNYQSDVKMTESHQEPGHDIQSTDKNSESKNVTTIQEGLRKNEPQLEVGTVAADNTNSESIRILNDEEMAKAALKIQTLFRGYLARNKMDVRKNLDSEVVDNEILKMAALVIQKTFRGYQSRKSLVGYKNPKDISVGAKSSAKIMTARSDNKESNQKVVKQATKAPAANEAPLLRKSVSKDNAERGNDIQTKDIGDESKNLIKTQKGRSKDKEDLDADIQSKSAEKIKSKDMEAIKSQVKPTNKDENKKSENINDAEMAKAALKIQTLFRGYLARNKIDVRKNLDSVVVDNEILRLAALVIQKTFRGYQARKSLVACKDSKENQINAKSAGIATEKPDSKLSNQTRDADAKDLYDIDGILIKPDTLQEIEDGIKDATLTTSGDAITTENIAKTAAEILASNNSKQTADESNLKELYDIDGTLIKQDKVEETNEDIKDEKLTTIGDAMTTEDINKNAAEILGSNNSKQTADESNLKELYDIDGTLIKPDKVQETNEDIKDEKLTTIGDAMTTEDINKNAAEILGSNNSKQTADESNLKELYDIDGTLIKPDKVQETNEDIKDEKLTTTGDAMKTEDITKNATEILGSNNSKQTADESNLKELYDIDGTLIKPDKVQETNEDIKDEKLTTIGDAMTTEDINKNAAEILGSNNSKQTADESNLKELYDIDGTLIKPDKVQETNEDIKDEKLTTTGDAMKTEDITKNDAEIVGSNNSKQTADESNLKELYDIDGTLIKPDKVQETNEDIKDEKLTITGDAITTVNKAKNGAEILVSNNSNQTTDESNSKELYDIDGTLIKADKLQEIGKEQNGINKVSEKPISKIDDRSINMKEMGATNDEDPSKLDQTIHKSGSTGSTLEKLNKKEDENSNAKNLYDIDGTLITIDKQQDIPDGTTEDETKKQNEIDLGVSASEVVISKIVDKKKDQKGEKISGNEVSSKLGQTISKSESVGSKLKEINKNDVIDTNSNPKAIYDIDGTIFAPEYHPEEKLVRQTKNLEMLKTDGILSDQDENEDDKSGPVREDNQNSVGQTSSSAGLLPQDSSQTEEETLDDANEEDRKGVWYVGNEPIVTSQSQDDESEGKDNLDDRKDGVNEDKNVEVNNDEAKAALQIQKSYRGYRARRDVSRLKGDKGVCDDINENELGDTETITVLPANENEDKAALQIQKSYRGYKTRKGLPQDKAIIKNQTICEADGSISNLEIRKDNIEDEDKEIEEASNETHDKYGKGGHEQNAALQIQKSYRGYKTRKDLRRGSPNDNDNTNNRADENMEKFQNENVNEQILEKRSAESLDKSMIMFPANEDEDKAALQIQKSYRGYKTRKDLSHGNIRSNKEAIVTGTDKDHASEKEEVILSDDTGLKEAMHDDGDNEEKAAVQIQKSYRGYKTRKNLKQGNEKDQLNLNIDIADKITDEEENKEKNIDIPNEDQEKAALEIQKSYRGYRARKDIRDGKHKRNKEIISDGAIRKDSIKGLENDKLLTSDKEQNEKDNISDSSQNSTEDEKAALQIQKTYRGYRARKTLKEENVKPNKDNVVFDDVEDSKNVEKAGLEKERNDIKQDNNTNISDSVIENNPEGSDASNQDDKEKAASQIQKSYRGYRARKGDKQGNMADDRNAVTQRDISDTELQAQEKKDNDTEKQNDQEKAALQIQKSYRGYRSRKGGVKEGNKQDDTQIASQEDISDTTSEADEQNKKGNDPENQTGNDKEKAALQIQKSYRGYRSRKDIKERNKPEDSHTATEQIISDTTSEDERSNKNDKEKAALQIQKSYRGYRSRKGVKPFNKTDDNPTGTQGNISETTSEGEENNNKKDNDVQNENKNDEEKAALQIQKSYRGYRSRKGVKQGNKIDDNHNLNQGEISDVKSETEENHKKDNDVENQNENEEEKAALQIQKSYRGYRSRKGIKEGNKPEDSNDAKERVISDTTSDDEKNNKNDKEKAAVQIQKSYRGYRSRRKTKPAGDPNKQTTIPDAEEDNITDKVKVCDSEGGNVVQMLNEKNDDQEKAALQIQKSYRGYRTRKDLNHEKHIPSGKDLKKDNAIEDTEGGMDVNEENAALQIQKSYRGYRTRKDLKKGVLQTNKKVSFTEKEEKTPEEFVDNIVALSQEQAALQIQKCYRGYRTRSDLQDGKLTTINRSDRLLLPKAEDSLEENSSNRNDVDQLSIVNEEEFADRDIGSQVKLPKDEEGAALQIQKTYRGYRSRKDFKANKQPDDNLKKEDIQGFVSQEEDSLGCKQDIKTGNEEVDDTMTSDITASAQIPSDDEAALRIQKSYRGYVARKNLPSRDVESKVEDNQTDAKENKLIDDEIDVEQHKAATQIQKSYRGYRTRRDLQGQMNPVAPSDEELAVEKEESGRKTTENILSEDEAALKIQKSYRGHKVRKDIENEKKLTKGSDILEKEESGHFGVEKENRQKIEFERSQISRNNSKNDLIEDEENKNGDVGTKNIEHIKKDETILEPSDIKENNKAMGKTIVLSKGYLPLPTSDNVQLAEEDSKAEIQNPSDIPEVDNLEEAAINIQKNYRGYRARKNLKAHPDSSGEQELTDSNKILNQTDNEYNKEKETSPDLDATYITTPSTALVSDLDTPGHGTAQNLRNLTEDEAAIHIQKSYRGYKARRQTAPDYKQVKPVDEDFYMTPDGDYNVDTFNVEEEKAATEIQKTYRGYRVRRDLNRQLNPGKNIPNTQHDIVSDSGISSNNQSDVDTSSTLQSDGETVRYDEPHENESGKSSDSHMTSFEILEEPFIEKRYSVANRENGTPRDLSSADSVRQKSHSSTRGDPPDIEKIDISVYGEDSLEAMYYSLKKNELMLDKMHQRASEHKSAGKERSNTLPFDGSTDPVKNMDELQREKLSDDDFGNKDAGSLASEESRPETAIRKSELSKSKKDTNNYSTSDDEDELEDDADDIDDITSDAIRRNMLAYSVSEADSDYYEIAAEKTNAIRDDFNISTAFETITSSDTDSTIVSAATKIQAGARGFLTRRRLRRASVGTSSFSERRASFGNAAIGKSLDDLIEQQEQIGMDEAASRIQKSFRRYKKRKTHQSTPLLRDSTDDTSSKNTSEEGVVGITEVKLEQKAFQVLSNSESTDTDVQQENEPGDEGKKSSDTNDGDKSSETSPQTTSRSDSTDNEKHANLRSVNFDGLNLAARRMTLQRGDAVQRNSTPEEENGNNSVPAAPIDAETGEFKALTKKKTVKPSRIARLLGLGTRQRTMPVQIDSEIMRIIPKHLRKRIKSAEAEKKKRNQLF